MAAPRKENIRDIIIDSTVQLLGEKAVSDVSLAEIAKRAGISKGTLYYYYKTKNDILFEITDRHLSEQWDNLIAWTEDESKDTSVHRLVKYVMEGSVSSAAIRMQLYCDVMQGDEAIRQKLIVRYREFHELISRKISQRTADLPGNYLTWLILLAADGLVIQQTVGGNIDVNEFIRQTSMYLRLLDERLKNEQ